MRQQHPVQDAKKQYISIMQSTIIDINTSVHSVMKLSLCSVNSGWTPIRRMTSKQPVF